MEKGKFYKTSIFTISVISDSELIYFTNDSITRCSHYPFKDDVLTEISKDEYKERLDKLMIQLNMVDEADF